MRNRIFSILGFPSLLVFSLLLFNNLDTIGQGQVGQETKSDKSEKPQKIKELPSNRFEQQIKLFPPPIITYSATAEIPVPKPTASATTKDKTPNPGKTPGRSEKATPTSSPQPIVPTSARVEKQPPAPANALLQPGRGKYTGEPISMDFKEGDLLDFFRLFSQITGLNIVLDPTIKGTISLKMVNVPYDQVFDIVLENNDLDKKIEGNVVRIARKETLRREEEERRKLKEAQVLAADTVTEIIKLNYANAEILSKTLSKNLSPKGEIVVDKRTNVLIVKDIPIPIADIKRLVKEMDVSQPQVEIEARIVSATRSFAHDIGVQFGFVAGNLQRATIGGPNTFGTIGGTRPSTEPKNTYVAGNPSSGRGATQSSSTESAMKGTGIGDTTPGNFNVNLPAQAPNRFSGLGFSLGNIIDLFLLDTAITAGEARGQAKLVSQPKVTAQNNSEASITQGVRFPVQTIQNNTVTTQFFDAALRLIVTPQITDEGTVLLNIKVENNVADFVRQVNGIPTIRTSESHTQVLVPDGGTTVIAGILVDTENRLEQRAPGIASIPILGNLFKRKFNERNTQEIIFFITPRVRKGAV